MIENTWFVSLAKQTSVFIIVIIITALQQVEEIIEINTIYGRLICSTDPMLYSEEKVACVGVSI